MWIVLYHFLCICAIDHLPIAQKKSKKNCHELSKDEKIDQEIEAYCIG